MPGLAADLGNTPPWKTRTEGRPQLFYNLGITGSSTEREIRKKAHFDSIQFFRESVLTRKIIVPSLQQV